MVPHKIVKTRQDVSLKQAHKLVKKFSASLDASAGRTEEIASKLNVLEEELKLALSNPIAAPVVPVAVSAKKTKSSKVAEKAEVAKEGKKSKKRKLGADA